MARAPISPEQDDGKILAERAPTLGRGFLGSQAIKWNFTKFLVDRNGRVVERFAPTAEPKALEGAIEALL